MLERLVVREKKQGGDSERVRERERGCPCLWSLSCGYVRSWEVTDWFGI